LISKSVKLRKADSWFSLHILNQPVGQLAGRLLVGLVSVRKGKEIRLKMLPSGDELKRA
jgi:hypothetical protein